MSELEYNDICRHLKRYRFEEKMHMCHKYSSLLIDGNGNTQIEKMRQLPFPWELETFLLLSIRANPEYDDNTFEGKNEKVFIKMINAIRNYEHPILEEAKKTEKFVNLYFSSMGLNQFDIQETKQIKLFRYNYIFTFENEKINMKEEFRNFFGTDYREFLEFGSFLTLLFGAKLFPDNAVIEHIAVRCFPTAFFGLTIGIEEYRERLDSVTEDIRDYTACYRPSFQYPFIRNGKNIYFPLPHLLIRSVTSSLLFRMTENNNSIRSLIGKEVTEAYLYEILIDSGVYDEVYRENSFNREHRQKVQSLDIMARENDEYLFVECKMTVPPIGIRVYDYEQYQAEVCKLAEKIIQVYKHLKKYLPQYGNYTCFETKPTEFQDKIWGIVSILEDGFVRRELVYEEAARQLDIEQDSDEYRWLITHIKIGSFYDIEKYALHGKSLIDGMKEQMEKGQHGDFSFPFNYTDCQRSDKYESFIAEMLESLERIAQKLEDDNVIK